MLCKLLRQPLARMHHSLKLLLLATLLLLMCRKKNNIVYMKEHGFAEEMLDGLLNLDLALQCDGFVSSINSNWARWVGTTLS